MSLSDKLFALGGKLGILKVSAPKEPAAPQAGPAKLQMRTITLAELSREVNAPGLNELAQQPDFLAAPLSDIYAAAGLQPPENGWGVERLTEHLKSPALKGLSRAEVQAELSGMFVSPAAVEDVLREALGRDQALDRFETVAKQKLEERAARRAKEIAGLEQRITELQAALGKLRQEAAAAAALDAEHWNAWLTAKDAAEAELEWTVSFLTEKPIVTRNGS